MAENQVKVGYHLVNQVIRFASYLLPCGLNNSTYKLFIFKKPDTYLQTLLMAVLIYYILQVIQLPDIWRTCNKIRSAVYRLGFDLREFFKPLDPKQRNLVSGKIVWHSIITFIKPFKFVRSENVPLWLSYNCRPIICELNSSFTLQADTW